MAFKLECSTCGEKLCQFCGSCHQINELDIHCPEYVPECSEAKVKNVDYDSSYKRSE